MHFAGWDPVIDMVLRTMPDIISFLWRPHPVEGFDNRRSLASAGLQRIQHQKHFVLEHGLDLKMFELSIDLFRRQSVMPTSILAFLRLATYIGLSSYSMNQGVIFWLE